MLPTSLSGSFVITVSSLVTLTWILDSCHPSYQVFWCSNVHLALGKILFGAKYFSKSSYMPPSPSDYINGGEGQQGVNSSSSTFLSKRCDWTTCLYICLSWELDRNLKSSFGEINWPDITKFSRLSYISYIVWPRKVSSHFMQLNGFERFLFKWSYSRGCLCRADDTPYDIYNDTFWIENINISEQLTQFCSRCFKIIRKPMKNKLFSCPSFKSLWHSLLLRLQ